MTPRQGSGPGSNGPQSNARRRGGECRATWAQPPWGRSHLQEDQIGLYRRRFGLAHSWVMDTATIDGQNRGQMHLAAGYPEPDWDVEHTMVRAGPLPPLGS